MKRYIVLLSLVAFVSSKGYAQDMNEVLQKTFTQFDTTYNDVEAKKALGNKLGLIAKKWNEEWVTHFYNAYAKAQLSYMEKDEATRDAYVDQAEQELDEAISLLGKEDDETYIMKAMIAQARMAVDGRNRWQKYGKIFEENLDKAKEINENNPRYYYLKGTAKYFTPKMFGGGAKAAKPYFEKAAPLFAAEENAPITDITWGSLGNQWFLKQIEEGNNNDNADEGGDK